MSYKNLNLDRGKIDNTIQEWAGVSELPKPIKKGNGLHYCVSKNGNEIRLIVYLKNDGTTSIDVAAGKNRELSKEAAEYIVNKCLIAQKKNFTLSFKNVDIEAFELLLDFLKEEIGAEIIEEKESDSQRILKMKGPDSDTVTITYYSNKTVLIQGKPLNLYIEIKLFFYEILSFEEVIQKEAECYEIDLNVDDIRNELKSFLPGAHSFLEDKVIKAITPSLALTKISIVLEDYSCFIFPVLKGLEGYMRQLLKEKAKEDSTKNSQIGKLFREDPNNHSYVQDFVREEIGCGKTCQALEGLYNFWRSKRHPYFHMGRNIMTTPLIYDEGTATALIHDSLNLIEKSFNDIGL